MTVLLGVSMGARTVRMAQPRTERSGLDTGDVVDGAPRPLFFRNEAIDTADEDVEYLAAESIGAATQSDPETATGVAYRDARQYDALHQAMESRQVQNYHLVPEVEAVVEYLAATGEADGCESVALFDLGSAGLTVSVVDLARRTVIASRRNTEFSGDTFDDILVHNQLDRLGKSADASDIELFAKRCRVAKERLSTNDAVCLPDESGMILISRDSFELLIGPALDESIEWARGVLIDANAPIDAVVLIGGCARIPLVRERVGPILELPSITPTEPETVSARGAALSARTSSTIDSPAPAAPARPVPARLAPARPVPARPVPSNRVVSTDAAGTAASAVASAAAASGASSTAASSDAASTAAPDAWATAGTAAVPSTPQRPVPAARVVSAERPVPATRAVVDQPIAHTVAMDKVSASEPAAAVALPAPVGGSGAPAAPAPEREEPSESGSVPFQLKNVYWLDAGYEDDDGEDEGTIRRRRLRTGGVFAFVVVAAVALSAFLITRPSGEEVIPASVTQSEVSVAPTTKAPAPTTTLPPAVVVPPPAPAPVTTTAAPEPEVVEPERETVRQEPVTTEPQAVTPAPVPPTVAPAPEPPPLIPGLPDFTLPTIPPLFPPAP